jgi:ABC-type lipoprotein export system ATPase subunit
MVTHNPENAALAGRTLQLRDGRLASDTAAQPAAAREHLNVLTGDLKP